MSESTICAHCGKPIAEILCFRTSSPFFPSGYLPYCSTCLTSFIDVRNISQVDKLCQWANWPFYPSRWLLLTKGRLTPEVILTTYYKQNILQLYKEGYDSKVDWFSVNQEWQKLAESGNLVQELSPEKQKEKEETLRKFWEVDCGNAKYTIDQLEHLDKLYADLERTQNIATGAQADQAKKLCRLSLDMDIAQSNHELELYVKLMQAYEKLVKVAEFTPRASQSNSSFESVGELIAFLEKTGFINRFYDGEQRDIVDKTIKNQQIFLRRLVSGESNLSERIEQRLQRMDLLDRMEDGTTNEDEWSYDLQKDEDWIDDSNYEEYEDEDESEELEVDE